MSGHAGNESSSPNSGQLQLVASMGPPRRVPAWLLSMILHATILAAMAYAWRFAPRGAAVEPDRTAGIVLIKQHEGHREYFTQDQETSGRQLSDNPHQAREQVLPTEQDNPVDLAAVLPSTTDILGVGDGVPLPGAGDLTTGHGRRRTLGGTVQTQVFGVPGEGSTFVYVFDRSGSMDGYGGRPLMAAKSELLASLDDLERVHQFQIIFYNEQPRIFNPDGGTPRLVWGDSAHKEKARRFVRGIVADGGTRHIHALEMALRMGPDIIFFLTDADEPQLSAEELARIRRKNGNTMINAIEFGFGPRRARTNFLQRLARQNGGRHVYVDVSLLRNIR